MFGLLKKFQVSFDRSTSEQVTLDVEACTEEEAVELARERIHNDEFGDLCWEQTDYTGDMQMVYVAEDLLDEC